MFRLRCGENGVIIYQSLAFSIDYYVIILLIEWVNGYFRVLGNSKLFLFQIVIELFLFSTYIPIQHPTNGILVESLWIKYNNLHELKLMGSPADLGEYCACKTWFELMWNSLTEFLDTNNKMWGLPAECSIKMMQVKNLNATGQGNSRNYSCWRCCTMIT